MHSRFERRLGTGRKAVAFGFFVVLALTFLAFVGSARAGIESGPAPQIWSDKADYAPGETVVLSGVNWAPGESVHIRVNDDEGQTWSRDVDVTADDAGGISDQFNLPDWFVANYTVTATGATGTATTSFTDGNVKFVVAPTGTTAQFVETLYTAQTNCTGAVKSGYPKTLNGEDSDTVGLGSNESLRLDAAATSDQGGNFSAWSTTNSATFTVIAGTGGKSICITGAQSGNPDLVATYLAPNVAPVANAQSVTTNEDTAKTITLTGTDADGNNLTFAIVSNPSNGTLGSIGAVNCTGTAPKTCSANVTYTPALNYNGPDSFTFRVNDGTVNSANATVSITVNAINDAPTCTNGSATTNEDTAKVITLSCADVDAGASLSYTIVSGPTHGSLSGSGANRTYTPDANYNGSDSFTFKANDGTVDSNVATFNLTVTAVDDPPTITRDDAFVTVDEGDTAVNSGTYGDVDGDTVTLSASVGTVTKNGDGTWDWSFDTSDGPEDSQTVTISASDGTAGDEAEATYDLTVANVAPTVVLSGAGSVDEGSTHTYTYIVTDPGQDTFTVSAGFPDCGTGGSVTGTPSTTASGGSFDCFFPDGPDTTSVAIKVADSDGASDTDSESVVVVQVANVNPNVSAPADQAANEGASSSFTLGSFSDPGPDSPWAVDVDWGDGSPHGTASKATTGSLGSMSHTYADGPATKTVTVTVTDTNGGVGSASFQVAVANVAPTVVLSGDTSANEGTTHTYTYTVSDPGADPNPTVVESCGSGTKTDTAAADSFDCSFPDGPENVTVTVSADDGDPSNNTGSDSKTVAVANVAPTVVLSAGNDLSVNEGAAEHTYSYTISDPGVDTVSSVSTSCGANGAKVAGSDTNTNSSGSFKCSFADGPANSTVSVQATDSDSAAGNTATQTVTVANVAPTATLGNNGPVDEGSAVSVSFSDQSDPSTGDTTAGFHYAYACDNSSLSSATYAGSGTSASKSCTFGDNGSKTVRSRIIDRNGGYTEYQTIVTVRNVDPTRSNASFTFDPVFGTATAGFDFGDVGWLDTHGPSLSFFTWSDVGNRYASVTEENSAPDATGHASDVRTLNPGCYNLTVTGTAKDDDGGTSASLAIYSNSATSVYGRGFRPPIMDNERNIAKYGNVVPVKVVLTNTCTGATVTNVPLFITLAKGVGDEAIEDTNLIAESVSAADTGSQMRTADGMYIFNLSTKSLVQNTDYTIRIRPTSTTAPYILQAVLYPKK
ncbi:MAG TPA: Ig-like domain-containing protein [Gaiellaceae bacterium]|nr:Ig-like domain-containing protein [Gaiellaceae bacterium]